MRIDAYNNRKENDYIHDARMTREVVFELIRGNMNYQQHTKPGRPEELWKLKGDKKKRQPSYKQLVARHNRIVKYLA